MSKNKSTEPEKIAADTIAPARFIRFVGDTKLTRFNPKRVAIYTRVSTATELKHHSIEAQKEGLTEIISHHPDWVLADIYIDEGVTGTKLNRPAFNRLMQDTEDGKIDIILTKTVSRIGRNAAAVQKVIRRLKELGVTVIFDNEKIGTSNPDSAFYLQFLGTQAEAEARANSDYQRWSIRSRFADGIPSYNRLYGYYMEDHQLIIIPEEAKVIKRIFKLYLSGLGMEAICKRLNQDGIPSPKNTKWRPGVIYNIIRNEKYTGDMLLQKFHTVDCLTKFKRVNRSELPQYYLEDTHEPIIDKTTFNKVQEEIARRAKVYGGHNTHLHQPNYTTKPLPVNPRVLNRLLYCPHCNEFLHYKRHSNKDCIRELWVCARHLKEGANVCPTKSIREDIVLETTKKILVALGLIKTDTELTNDLLKLHLKKIVVDKNQTLIYHFHNGTVITKTWQYESRSKSWTPEMINKAREKAIKEHQKKAR